MKSVYTAALAAVLGSWLAWTIPARADSTPLVPPTTRPAADVVQANPDPARYLFEDQLSPGMKGYGLTVMHGNKIEKFNVEIIDVVRNFSPGHNAILVRCSGLGLEHTGIIAGMSGSPVFINGKMIGAIAYGWGMSKDPIGGVQPIRQMLAIPTTEARTADGRASSSPHAMAGGAEWAGKGLLAREAAGLPGWKTLAASLAKRAGASPLSVSAIAPEPMTASPEGLRPLVSPLMVGGASPSTLQFLQSALAGTGLMPVASGSAGASGGSNGLEDVQHPVHDLGGLAELKPGDIQLEPGSAIAVPLVTGDMDLSAIGTVTEVRNGRVYAFGHSFMGDGETQLPIATGYIYTIMPNVSQSFKMGTSVSDDGTLVMDEQTGIVGVRGKAPATIPVKFSVRTADGLLNKVYHYRLAPHPHLTAEMLGAILNETLIAQRTLPQNYTARILGKAVFKTADGEKSVTLDNLGATSSFSPAATLLPIAVLSDNPFEDLKLKDLSLEATIEDKNRSGTIGSIMLDRLTAAPGDELTAVVEVTPFQGSPRWIPMKIRIPKDAQDGQYMLTVGSSQMALMQEASYAPQRFDPQDIGGLENAVSRILSYRPDCLYATLQLNVSGASVAGRELKNLPASRIAMYASEQRTDATPLFLVKRTEVKVGSILADGGQVFAIRVDHRADRRYFEPKQGPMGPAAGPGSLRLSISGPAPASAPADGPGD